MATAMIVWLRNCMTFIFRVKQLPTTYIEGDSLSGIKAIQKEAISNNLRHVYPREMYCRAMFQDEIIRILKVTTDKLLADTLTKLLPNKKFQIYKMRLLNLGGVDHSREMEFVMADGIGYIIRIDKSGEEIVD